MARVPEHSARLEHVERRGDRRGDRARDRAAEGTLRGCDVAARSDEPFELLIDRELDEGEGDLARDGDAQPTVKGQRTALERDAADGGAQARKLANLHPLLHDNGRIAQYAARRRADARGRRVRHPVWHLVTLAGRLPLYQHRACELIRAKEEGASGSGARSGGGHAGVEVAVAAGRAKTEW